MFQLVKKDFLTLSKSKSDLGELLLMPFILIAILGFALGNLLMSGGSISSFEIGLVIEQDRAGDSSQFEADLIESGMPEELAAQLLVQAGETDPAAILSDVLTNEGFAELFTTNSYENTEAAQEAMEQEEIAGYITIPAGFSYQVWQAVYLNEEGQASLDVDVRSGTTAGTILQSIANTFVDQYNLDVSIALATDGQADLSESSANHGDIRQISVEEPVNAFQYYTIGMGVMFALSTAPALAIRAYTEKEQHVFGRIMLSGTKPLTYLASKMVTGTLVTFVQLLILFIFSTLLFGAFRGRDIDFWMDMIAISGVYALLVGAVTSLLTAASLNANDATTANFFGAFVSVFAFLGGSFTPVEQFSETLRHVGNWTPNGAAMTSYLQILQGFNFPEVWPLMIRVVGMTVLCLIASIVIFPRRRLD